MLGVQDERRLERADGDVVGFLARDRPEEVRRVPQVLARGGQVLAAAAALRVGDDRGQGGEEAFGLGEFRGRGVVGRLRVQRAQHAHGGADDVHGVRGRREVVDDAADPVVEGPARAFPLAEGVQGRGVRQVAVPQQARDLLEGALRRELLHGVPAVQQRVRRGVDLGDGRGVRDDTGQALVDRGVGHPRFPSRLKSYTEESKSP